MPQRNALVGEQPGLDPVVLMHIDIGYFVYGQSPGSDGRFNPHDLGRLAEGTVLPMH